MKDNGIDRALSFVASATLPPLAESGLDARFSAAAGGNAYQLGRAGEFITSYQLGFSRASIKRSSQPHSGHASCVNSSGADGDGLAKTLNSLALSCSILCFVTTETSNKYNVPFSVRQSFPLNEVRRMSFHEFIGRLSRAQVSENDRKWMPKWLAEYASFLRQDSGQKLKLNEKDVLTFLRGLRDRGVPAWQRLQATRTLDWYQSLVGKRQMVDFSPIVTKLNQ